MHTGDVDSIVSLENLPSAKTAPPSTSTLGSQCDNFARLRLLTVEGDRSIAHANFNSWI